MKHSSFSPLKTICDSSHSFWKRQLLLTTVCSALLGLPSLKADNGLWSGMGSDRAWSNADNWEGGEIASGFGKIALFLEAAANTDPILLPTSLMLGRIEFQSEDLGAQVIGTQGGPALEMYHNVGNSSIWMDVDVVASQRVNAPLQMWNHLAFINDSSAANLIIGGDVSRHADATGALTLWMQGANRSGVNEFSGRITGSGVKLGIDTGGTWRLSGASTHTDGSTLNGGGITEIGHDQAFGTGFVEFQGTGGTLRTIGGPKTLSNALHLRANATLETDDHLILNGYLTQYAGSRTLTVQGQGEVTLAGDVYISSQPTVQYRLTISNSAKMTISGVISDEEGDTLNNSILTKQGAGTLVLTQLNTYSGGTEVKAGMLEITHSGALGSGRLHLNGGGFRVSGGEMTIANTVRLEAPGDYATSVIESDALLRLTGAVTNVAKRGIAFNGSGVLELTGPVYISADTTSNAVLTIAGNGRTVISGVVANDASTNTRTQILRKTGTGTLVLTGVNTYTGITELLDGVLEASEGQGLGAAGLGFINGGAGGVLQTSGTFSRGIGAAAGQVWWSNASGGFAAKGGDLAVNLYGDTRNLNWSAILSGSHQLIFGSTTADHLVDFQNGLNLGAVQRTVWVNDNAASAHDIARLSGQITSSDVNGGLRKIGSGVLELSHTSNSYAGATVVEEGVLRVTGSLTHTSGVSVAAGAALEGNGTIAATVSGAGRINPGNSPGTLTVAAVNPDDGVDFGFEFLGGGRDILRMTNLTTPFAGSGILDGDNTISLYLDAAAWASLSAGSALEGGFYLDGGDFSSAFNGAQILGFFHDGSGYQQIDGWEFSLALHSNALFVSTGFMSSFTATQVPEPGTWAILVAGGAYLLLRRRKRA